MIRRRLAIAALVLAAFFAGVALTLPTDAIVRGLLARVPMSEQTQLTFAQAHLRPSGLLLDDVHMTQGGGRTPFDAEWVRLRPSLLGFWRDGTGRPWNVTAATCQGTITVEIGTEPLAMPVTLTLENVEAATCLGYVAPQIDAYGRVSGTVHARLATRDPNSGDVALELRGAAWRPGGALAGDTIRADAATVRGHLADRRFEIETLEASSDDFRASGRGSIRFNTPTSDSVLDVHMTVTPTRTFPSVLRRLFDGVPGAPPDATGMRRFHLQGTIANPRFTASGTPE